MGFGVSLFLLAIGAILAVAVTAEVEGIDLGSAGLILMAVGGVGLLWSVISYFGENGTKYLVKRDEKE